MTRGWKSTIKGKSTTQGRDRQSSLIFPIFSILANYSFRISKAVEILTPRRGLKAALP